MPSKKDLRRTWTKLRNNLRVFGPVDTARAVLLHLLNRSSDRFDRRYGVSTDGDFTASDVTSPNLAYASPYQPTHERVLRHLFESLPIEPAAYSFVDLGCGKGRALLMASELPFAQIVGIEFSPSLCADAEQNLARFRRRHGRRVRCERVEVVCGDVCDLDLPPGDLVLYLFNPFETPVLERVLERIGAAAAREPRDVLVAYCHAKHGTDPLVERGCELLAEHRVISPWWSWSLWRWPREATVGERRAGPTPLAPEPPASSTPRA